MRALQRFFVLLFLFSSFNFSIAQTQNEPEYIDGELLVQIVPGEKVQSLIRSFQDYQGTPINMKVRDFISPPMNIYHLEYEFEQVDQMRILYEVKMHPAVQEAQFNHLLQKRVTPNDTEFNQQWQYVNTGQGGGTVDADIDADEAWDITTGGLTALGDTIVLCVIDDGLDTDHSDFGDNVWINHGEIPNNNIDDDGNGYDDDYLGWNADDDNDDITGGFFGGGHGTPVAGIVGAKGNNNNGVTGVNWDVKVMIVVGGGNEAQAVEAYTYPLTMRKLYNQSGGTQGAFVVGTNASWGIDYGQPSNAPLWCAMYDTLGHYGVLSAGATINGNENVDQVGDLPTACPSDYLISVTNTNNTDVKVTQAGYGSTTIDLGAPGQGTHTPQSGGGYGGFGGTSGATPHVTGTIGLLYSAPCPSFITLAHADPEQAAGLIKDYIMNGTDANSSLNGITVSGGRLNLRGALDELINNCSGSNCLIPFSVVVNNITDDEVTINWNSGPNAIDFTLEYKQLGAPFWTTLTNVSPPQTLTGLEACTEYQFRLEANCTGETSGFTDTLNFETEGCCEPPANVYVSNIGETFATFTWDDVFAADSFNLRYREDGTGNWTTLIDLTDTTETVNDLDSCTDYEVQVQSICMGQTTDFTTPVEFSTTGCGACLDLTYCNTNGDDASEEWIANVTLNTINNSTGTDGGYGDYTTLNTELARNMRYAISLTPDYSGQDWDEYFRVWIDWNSDGDFGDSGELAFDAGGTTTTTINDSIDVPANAVLGTTRVRVSMWYDETPMPCEIDFDFGEAEDYCVTIVDEPTGISEMAEVMKVFVYPNPFSENTTLQFSNPTGDPYLLSVYDISGKLISEIGPLYGNRFVLNGRDLKAGVYFYDLKTNGQIKARGKLIAK